ncbi:MAG: hypothetical protein GKR94_15165 [Gammaproteobacteria bacterium]|nr:hypothetical protein [Gammaproteobacteria bacterium]
MEEQHHQINAIECALHELQSESTATAWARRTLCVALQQLAGLPEDTSLSLAETFEAIARDCADAQRRTMGLVITRLVSSSELLPKGSIEKSGRHVVALVEQGCPDLLNQVVTNKKAQTHEKLAAIQSIHSMGCERLMQLSHPFTNLQGLDGRRQTILRDLNHGPTKAYLNAFGYGAVYSSVTSLLALVARVVQSQGHELQGAMQSLLDSVDDEINQYEDVGTFLVRDYFLPFVQAIRECANALNASLADRFQCSIAVPTSPYRLEKRYPLHIVGSRIQVFVPLTNKGPGTAQDVVAYCIADNCVVRTEETRLGSIEPSRFVLTLIFEVTQPLERADLYAEVTWNVVEEASLHRRDFSVSVEGQRTDLDWELLIRKKITRH